MLTGFQNGGLMSGVDDSLREIARLCKEVKPADAQALAISLIEGLAIGELEARATQLRTAFEAAFFKKRKIMLLELLDEKLYGPPPAPATAAQASAQAEDAWLEEFHGALQDLSDRHIFQWSTYYRDRLAEDFNYFLDRLADPEEARKLLPKISSALSSHAEDIFQKGFNYQTAQGES
ncbi:hypothetical protein ACFTXB_29835, partial [Streptomyces sp. NPDC057074]|uniref:hypothetical protein n=1 Tax=Streptomyces sp. NPDC057074 TaxID=3346015 RepID=UPI0036422466